MPPRHRVVLDTNILLRGLVNSRSASGKILCACDDRRIIPILSKPVLAEYRYVLTDLEVVAHYPQLELRKVMVLLEHLIYIGDLVRRVSCRFDYRRDPKDAKFVELSVAGKATHLISTDIDLLTLPHGRDDASKQFRRLLPGIEVLPPDQFVQRYGEELE